MPTRLEPFVNANIYHIFNKTIDQKRVFQSDKYSQEFYQRLIYYRSTNSTRSYSDIDKLNKETQEIINQDIFIEKDYQIKVLSYSFMPNHYHFLLEQCQDDGISGFVSKVTNSFTRYYNLKNQRKGQLFLKDFKAVLIRTDEQLIHTSRYIHLNPYSGGVVNNLDELVKYDKSSFPNYLGLKNDKLVSSERIMSSFKNIDEYKNFVFDRAEYQREIEDFKHITNFTINQWL